jgi:alpha-galactosidase
MADGSYAAALLNRGTETAEMSVSPPRDLEEDWAQYRARDLWKHKEGIDNVTFSIQVMPHKAKILRLWEVKPGFDVSQCQILHLKSGKRRGNAQICLLKL